MSDAPVSPTPPAKSVSFLRRAVLGLVVVGALIQIAMSAYYLANAHAPKPHHLPVGYVAAPAEAAQLDAMIEEGGRFRARSYADVATLTRAIRRKDIYGGVDTSAAVPRLYVASAAGTLAASTLKGAFTQVVEQRRAQQLQRATASGRPVPAAQVKALATPPAITDLVALPDDDSTGAAIGLLVQALALGATIASLALGKIGAGTTPSLRRGLGHAAALAAYAGGSALAVLVAAKAFGVVPDGAGWRMLWSFALLSLAITASVAAMVALVGPPGTLLGTAYFLFGVPVAGSSVLPEFLPPLARGFGQVLPTGAGTTLVRDNLYFPDAALTGPLATLVAYAVLGLGVVLATNAVANHSTRRYLLARRG